MPPFYLFRYAAIIAAASLPSATACTTVFPPFTISPPVNTFSASFDIFL